MGRPILVVSKGHNQNRGIDLGDPAGDIVSLGTAGVEILGRYRESVEAMDRGLAGNLGRNTQLTGRSVLAASYAQLDRRQDADRKRNVVMRMAPFLSTERFAGQFGTQEARDQMLEGLRKAGFR
jgi:hypothetical protein